MLIRIYLRLSLCFALGSLSSCSPSLAQESQDAGIVKASSKEESQDAGIVKASKDVGVKPKRDRDAPVASQGIKEDKKDKEDKMLETAKEVSKQTQEILDLLKEEKEKK